MTLLKWRKPAHPHGSLIEFSVQCCYVLCTVYGYIIVYINPPFRESDRESGQLVSQLVSQIHIKKRTRIRYNLQILASVTYPDPFGFAIHILEGSVADPDPHGSETVNSGLYVPVLQDSRMKQRMANRCYISSFWLNLRCFYYYF